MSTFISAVDAHAAETGMVIDGTKQLGENGAPEYTARGVGDSRVALFNALVRNVSEGRLEELIDSVFEMIEHTEDAQVGFLLHSKLSSCDIYLPFSGEYIVLILSCHFLLFLPSGGRRFARVDFSDQELQVILIFN